VHNRKINNHAHFAVHNRYSVDSAFYRWLQIMKQRSILANDIAGRKSQE